MLLVCGSVIAYTAPQTKVQEVRITDPVAAELNYHRLKPTASTDSAIRRTKVYFGK